VSDAAGEVNISHSTITTLPQQSVDDSSDDVTSEARTLEVDPAQPVSCPLRLPSVVGTDVDDVRTDCRHVKHDEAADMGLDETLYHDCISTSFTSELLVFSVLE